MVRCRRLLDKKGLDTDSHPCIPDPSEISPLKVPSDTVLSFFFFYFFFCLPVYSGSTSSSLIAL